MAAGTAKVFQLSSVTAGLPLDRVPVWPSKRARVIYAPYDLTFLREFSEGVLREFRARGVDFNSKILPCGHYTTGETPYKYIDGWYLGAFVYNAFKKLAHEGVAQPRKSQTEKELISQ